VIYAHGLYDGSVVTDEDEFDGVSRDQSERHRATRDATKAASVHQVTIVM